MAQVREPLPGTPQELASIPPPLLPVSWLKTLHHHLYFLHSSKAAATWSAISQSTQHIPGSTVPSNGTPCSQQGTRIRVPLERDVPYNLFSVWMICSSMTAHPVSKLAIWRRCNQSIPHHYLSTTRIHFSFSQPLLKNPYSRQSQVLKSPLN